MDFEGQNPDCHLPAFDQTTQFAQVFQKSFHIYDFLGTRIIKEKIQISSELSKSQFISNFSMSWLSRALYVAIN